ncbi:Wzz/FepE/Etk N-terminal domain-containing protein [Streptosporangium sp. NBC_01639]|uniref:Wzz/FepE/Etk N-terminal domain-containing protein n=1 Tax=Streptosporangium sp. NBC_01639 TaxID=2975948 RepID=UPI0038705D53|nr:Wzz/FepE/Etk N-terminal domain-containing protein [Streptosporangium sp. NBC_01639]
MSLPPDAPVRRSGGDLADYMSFLRRRWPTLLVFLLAGSAGGAALFGLTPPAYTASAQVLVAATGLPEQTNQVTSRQREALNLDTEVQIAQSATVAKKVKAALKRTPGPVEVSVPPNTSILQISYTAADPHAAATGADAYAQAYLDNRRESATQALDAQLTTLLTKLKQVNASLVTVVDSLPTLARGTTGRTIALQRQNVLSRQVYQLTVRYDALKTIAVTPGSVISDAVAPARPGSPSAPLHLGSGLMLGLLAGVGVAWGRDRLDTRIRAGSDIKRLTGLDIVGAREIKELTGTGSAVLLVSVPGTSSRDVTQAVRQLNERGIPVLGAVVTPPGRAPATSTPRDSGPSSGSRGSGPSSARRGSARNRRAPGPPPTDTLVFPS